MFIDESITIEEIKLLVRKKSAQSFSFANIFNY